MTQFEFVDEHCSSVMLAAHNAVTFLNETSVEQYAGDLSYCDLYFQGFQGTCFLFFSSVSDKQQDASCCDS